MEYSIFQIIILSIFVNNFVLARFLGLCPYMGVSKQLDSAIGMGMAVTFVMTIASLVTWLLYTFFLAPTYENVFYSLFNLPIQDVPDLTFLRTIVFILVIASLVQFIEMYIQKVSPTLYRALGIYLPLITTNCAILGVAVLNIDLFFIDGLPAESSFIHTIVQAFSAGLGFTLVLVLMAGIRERLEMIGIPKPLRGLPIAFIVAGLMSIAFLGFSGMNIG
ncbi:MAG: RnfABCDGE type electron transport complex subunit A [Calditrichaeota bacterium]|nr:RnfABCDGE type electron transport complex subunit A [Calditrichota bacterium]RQV99275.1 MAG: RnfABCDGE type electron transport complex subunit A [Calditrichota bacterium]